MRTASLALGLALALLAPLASAATPVSYCSALFCAHVQDTDDDGNYDWANFATSVEHAATLNANVDDGVLFVQADGGTEETVEPYHIGSALILVDTHDEGGVDEAWIFIEVYEGDEETGGTEQLAWRLVRAVDSDGDGVPETVTIEPAP